MFPKLMTTNPRIPAVTIIISVSQVSVLHLV